MKPFTKPILELFESKKRYEVPLFQRRYVWNREDNWEPLWEDILATTVRPDISTQTESPRPRFLGPMVLEQKAVFNNEIAASLIIDGQQRLMTFQMILAAFRDVCQEKGISTYAQESRDYLLNRGLMQDESIEKYKVYPSQHDLSDFKAVIESEARSAVETQYPVTKRKWARKEDPRPLLIECYLYFYDCISRFLESKPSGSEMDSSKDAAALFDVFRRRLQVVTIELEDGDDPQVIFETLNARGEPLLPSDLLRNSIFWRAGKQHETKVALYCKYWEQLEEEFWRQTVKQGRDLRPRIDIYLQHYLAYKQQREVNVRQLYSEYKTWLKKNPFECVEDELKELIKHSESFQQLETINRSTVIGRFSEILRAFDTKAIYPLVFAIIEKSPSAEILDDTLKTLESYIVRRAVCNLSVKNYNKHLISLIQKLPETLEKTCIGQILIEYEGESTYWPKDDRFREAWMQNPSYDILGGAQTRAILLRIEESLHGPKTDVVETNGELTVEHVLPEEWLERWPLPNGKYGIVLGARDQEGMNREDADDSDKRDVLKHSFGNLTLLSQPLNSSIQNSDFSTKRPEILKNSGMALNRYFHDVLEWNESSIQKRGEVLFSTALQLWPRNTSSS